MTTMNLTIQLLQTFQILTYQKYNDNLWQIGQNPTGIHVLFPYFVMAKLPGARVCLRAFLVLHSIAQSRCALVQWSPTLSLQMFLNFNSQKSWPAKVVVKSSESYSPRTSGGPRLGTTAPVPCQLVVTSHSKLWKPYMNIKRIPAIVHLPAL